MVPVRPSNALLTWSALDWAAGSADRAASWAARTGSCIIESGPKTSPMPSRPLTMLATAVAASHMGSCQSLGTELACSGSVGAPAGLLPVPDPAGEPVFTSGRGLAVGWTSALGRAALVELTSPLGREALAAEPTSPIGREAPGAERLAVEPASPLERETDGSTLERPAPVEPSGRLSCPAPDVGLGLGKLPEGLASSGRVRAGAVFAEREVGSVRVR